VVGVEGDNEGLPYYDDVLVHLGQSKKIERWGAKDVWKNLQYFKRWKSSSCS
jgi:hypothetical protein